MAATSIKEKVAFGGQVSTSLPSGSYGYLKILGSVAGYAKEGLLYFKWKWFAFSQEG